MPVHAATAISLQNVFFYFAFFLMTHLIQWSYDHCMPFPRRGEHRILNESALKVFRTVSSHVTYEQFYYTL